MNVNSQPIAAPVPLTPRQAEILDRTAELVAEAGLANLTMKRVAERVGFTEPAIYRHFTGKRGLVLGLVDRLGERLLGTLRAIAGDRTRPPRERLLGATFDLRWVHLVNRPSAPLGRLVREGPHSGRRRAIDSVTDGLASSHGGSR